MTDTYLIKGTVYLEGGDIDLEDLDLLIEVEAEFFPSDPSVGYMSDGYNDTEEDALKMAYDLIKKMWPDYIDYDVDVEKI